jgi:hypothetical protein
MGQLLGTLIRHAGTTPLAVARLPIAVIGTALGTLLVCPPCPPEGCEAGTRTARDAAVDPTVVG